MAIETIRSVFWSSLEEPARHTLVQTGRIRSFAVEDVLVRQGSQSDHVPVIRSGWTKSSAVDERGRELVVAVFGPGDIVGEVSLITEAAEPTTVTALHPVSALAVPRPRFEAVLEEHTAIWRALYRAVHGRLSGIEGRIMGLHGDSGRIRLGRLLLTLAAESGVADEGGGIRIPPLSQAELAACIDSSRETVARALRDYRVRGYIKTRSRHTTVLDAEGLEDHIKKIEW
ncbi:CRP-like cAMP-binding protein [Actinocorallia herbida]|uniref:CRP-like cAMP-binding protein n=1 Tax=Actinocorallia herbida TaxID=58109 RepID=A0A3N1D076_9ACTN|nr:Crp/Fnr family transcriptional regulator [Actinocorallia herbida]ROO86922.1 CRP-like cAMP-binding protein [Actinocorallia herbida]